MKAERKNSSRVYHIQDLTGQRFGRLVVVGMAPYKLGSGVKWTCICDCGNSCTPTGARLKNGVSKSCGCYARMRNVEAHETHGAKTKCGDPLIGSTYNSWRMMRTRCYNRKYKQFQYWGGRGISVCDRWRFGDGIKKGFECFLEDMEVKPTLKHTIERVDNDGNYCPENCIWLLHSLQYKNKRKHMRGRFKELGA